MLLLHRQTRLSVSDDKLREAFSKFYARHLELIETYHVSLEKLLQQGICNPDFYVDLYINIRKSLEIQTSLIFSNKLLMV